MKHGDLARIAWKNVRRNRRRSTLNIVALTVGISILIVCLGWIGGYHRYIYGTMIEMETGHIQVLRRGYYAEKRRLPVDLVVPDYETLRSRLEEIPGIAAAAGRISFSAKISAGGKSVRLLGRAVDPAREGEVSILPRQIVAGSYLDTQRGIMLSDELAGKLGVAPGDTVFVSAVDRYQVENLVDATVVGTFSFGYGALDDNVVFTDLTTADELLALSDEVTKVVIRLDNGNTLDSSLEEVQQVLDAYGRSAGGGDPVLLEARPWQDFARAAVSAVRGDTTGFLIMVIIMYILIVLGVLNSMSMTVHERTREIGTIRAIGMRRDQISLLLTYESFWIAAIAILLSLITTTPLAIYLMRVGVDIAAYMPEDLPVPFGEVFRADFRLWHYLLSIASGIVVAVVGSIVPARRAARIEVAEAMRGR